MNNSKNTLIQITKNGMGEGDAELGILLLRNYLKIILNDNRLPKIIVFYNAGVLLLSENSPVIAEFKNLEEAGVTLLACKTCINHFKLEDSIAAGVQGTMMDIITLQSDADKVINL
jgi:selenium metabolism protein YedF